MALGFMMRARRQKRIAPCFLGTPCRGFSLRKPGVLSIIMMRTHFIVPLLVGPMLSATAQFYPEAQACWHSVDDDGGPPNYHVRYQMGASPDTLINGTVYQVIEEFRDYVYTRSHFVRSDPTGKGYAYLPDSAAEFLTGDVAAQTGDTVHDVLWSNTYASGIDYFLVDMIVDNVAELNNVGVHVTRQYFEALTSGNIFWQAGMGTSFGPMLELTGSPWGCWVGDTMMLGGFPDWLPGPTGVEPCPLLSSGNVIKDLAEYEGLQAHPNPSAALFRLAELLPWPLTVLDIHGRVVLQLPPYSREIDLTAQPPGVYTALMVTQQERIVQRLIVMR